MKFPTDFEEKKEALLLELYELNEFYEDYKLHHDLHKKTYFYLKIFSIFGFLSSVIFSSIFYIAYTDDSAPYYFLYINLGLAIIVYSAFRILHHYYPKLDFPLVLKSRFKPSFFKTFFPGLNYEMTTNLKIQDLGNWSKIKGIPVNLLFKNIEDYVSGHWKYCSFQFFEANIVSAADLRHSIFNGIIILIRPIKSWKGSLKELNDLRAQLKQLSNFWAATARTEQLSSGQILISIENSKPFLELKDEYTKLYNSRIIEEFYREIQHLVALLHYFNKETFPN